jgi:hypothetical protein
VRTTRIKTEPKSRDEITRYDTVLSQSLPVSKHSCRREIIKSLSVLGTDKVGESLGLTAEVVGTVSVGVCDKLVGEDQCQV